jgi:FxsC-like protein
VSAAESAASPYFFLNYAPVPPRIEAYTPGTKRFGLVDWFFRDLVTRVRRLAERPAVNIGAYDRSLNPGQDRQSAVSEALSRAEVLVPLYSPRYFDHTLPQVERRAFEARVRAAHADPAVHIQPVLWLPLDSSPGPAAEVHDLAEVPEYNEFGLGGLCDLARSERPRSQAYRTAYGLVLNGLARRIVQVAEQSPIGPSPIPVQANGPVSDPVTADFVIGVFAPTSDTRPAAADPEAYGPRPVDWSPFATSRPAPIAAQAAYVAGRLETSVTMTSIPGGEALWANRPGVLLVDGWSVADESGAAALTETLRDLPSSVLALVVTDRGDARHAERAESLHRRAVGMLVAAGADRTLAEATDSTQFLDLMPILITQASRRFFSAMPKTYPSRPRFGVREARDRAEENGKR